jgi:thiamine biosynthesis lipoprotein
VKPALDPARFGIEAEADHGGSAIHRFAHEAMNTVFEVRCAHADPTYAGQAALAAFQVVDRLEQDLSRFIANSDVSRMSGLAQGEQARVSPWTMECLGLARTLHTLTGGAFDVSLGTRFEALEMLPDELTVRAHAGGVRIDLGGIGKGYAVDRMAELLEEWEIERALVHGGFSSVLATESAPDRDGWPLTLRAPSTGELLAQFAARRTALSASGVQKGAHILDPRTGQAIAGRAAWVALAIDRLEPRDAGRSAAALAEGLSTAFMILTEPEIERLCAAMPGAEAWLLLDGSEAATLVHFAAGSGPPSGPRRGPNG